MLATITDNRGEFMVSVYWIIQLTTMFSWIIFERHDVIAVVKNIIFLKFVDVNYEFIIKSLHTH